MQIPSRGGFRDESAAYQDLLAFPDWGILRYAHVTDGSNPLRTVAAGKLGLLHLGGAREMHKKILIVDDEVYIRVLLEQTLEDFEDAGIELLSADDGLEAWDIVQAEQPNLILLDVMLPGISGYDVCQRIKSDPDLRNIHVIMLTAKGQEVDRLRSIEVGANEYVTKPFDPDYLIERTSDVLGVRV